MSTCGIYIVTLNNEIPISANAHDARRPGAVKVTRLNCKLGKARSLESRRKNYEKTFGAKNVNFFAIAELENIDLAERSILARLQTYRLVGENKRTNEWLNGIDPIEVERIAFDVLRESGLTYRKIDSVVTSAA
jgi:hypothetical protein